MVEIKLNDSIKEEKKKKTNSVNMDLNLQDSELLYTFDYGIQIGSLISGLIKN
jgi:hypothetical protein